MWDDIAAVAVCALAGAVAGWWAPSLAARFEAAWGLHERAAADAGPRSWHRPLLTLAGGVACGAAPAAYGLQWRLPVALLMLAWLLLVAAIDLRTRLIPNRLTYPAIALSPLSLAMWPELTALGHLLGALVCAGFFLVALLLSPGSLGLGDVKLALVIGLYLGLTHGLVALVVTLLYGALAALVALAAGVGRRGMIAYGPMLAAGGATALVAGQQLWAMYTGAPVG